MALQLAGGIQGTCKGYLQTYHRQQSDNHSRIISLEVKEDHVYMHLVESAPFNKGSGKMYSGVPGNLVAFACKLSFQRGHEGNVSFISKTQLIEHYEKTLGAMHFGGRVMVIETTSALKLINRYFKNQ
ncbi:hypothetical protein [Rufibacter sp. XAAS-G3-1]|uniref:hypothetical protein n=1 Tax=Rufibacter sp. XAAS-G3-1 TaxID=2729134 RepID=UPI0021068F1A|nr:hypothetical protein [Rufibacter sp. XAAS-G3-1]